MSKKKIQPIPGKLTQAARTPAIPRSLKYTLAIIIGVFAFMLYAGSLNHDYTLDDHPVIDENSITTRGVDGIPILLNTDYWFGAGQEQSRGPVYRPASLIVFAMVWEFSPNNPQAYHFINVFLYALSCLVFFLVLCQLFKNQDLLFPFACALLFTAHPIHTEVVNNVKSLDEILCLFFGLISLSLVLRYDSTNSKWALIGGAVCFYISLISKETGITFLVIIPLAVYFFREISIKKISIPFFVLLLITGVWLLVRMSIFKELPQNTGTVSSVLNNTLNAAPDSGSRFATVFYILLRYLGLLLLPHPLSSDYSFSEIKIRSFSDPLALLGLIIYVGMGVYAILGFRKKNVVSFAILFYLIALAPVSNFFFLVGSTMAERFLYIPSIGFCMVMAYLLIRIIKTVNPKFAPQNAGQFFSYNKTVLLILAAIAVLYFFKTTGRTKDWKDNITLLSQDVKVSANSARVNQILGSALMLEAMKVPDPAMRTAGFVRAKAYLMKALQIYPNYYAPLSHLGVIYIYEGKFDSAHASLKRGLELMPTDVDLNFNYGLVLFNQKKYEEAIRVLNHTVQLSPSHESAHYNLAALYQNTRDHDKAIAHYAKVLEINPNNANAYYNTSVMLRARGENAKADEFLKKAQALGYKAN